MINKTKGSISSYGRSMVEMLSVLAVIGILSAVALLGYNWAMTYYRANETIHDVMIRGTNVPMIWEDYDGYLDPHEFEFAELGKTFKTLNKLGTQCTQRQNLKLPTMFSV